MEQIDVIQQQISLKEDIKDRQILEGKLAIHAYQLEKQIQVLFDEKVRILNQIEVYRNQVMALEDQVFDLEQMEVKEEV